MLDRSQLAYLSHQETHVVSCMVQCILITRCESTTLTHILVSQYQKPLFPLRKTSVHCGLQIEYPDRRSSATHRHRYYTTQSTIPQRQTDYSLIGACQRPFKLRRLPGVSGQSREQAFAPIVFSLCLVVRISRHWIHPPGMVTAYNSMSNCNNAMSSLTYMDTNS